MDESISYQLLFFAAILWFPFTFFLFRFGYVLKQFKFWRACLYWLSLFLFVFNYLYFGIPSDDSIFVNFFGIFILSLPLAIIVTYFNKWIVESRSNSLESTMPQQRIWEWYLLLCLGIYPLFIYIGFFEYYFFIWNILWAMFNISIVMLIFIKKIEKISLWLPVLALFCAFPFAYPHPKLVMFASMALGMALYFLLRKKDTFSDLFQGDKELSQKAWTYPLVSIIIVACLVYGVARVYYINSSTKNAIKQVAEQEKQMYAELDQYAKERTIEKNTPPPPNPVFDEALKKSKKELATYLSVPESEISLTSYYVEKEFKEGYAGSFCRIRNIALVPFKDLSPSERITTNNDAKLLSENTFVLTTNNNGRASLSLPLELPDPVPTHISFDYRFEKGKDGILNILFDDTRIGFVKLSQMNGYAKDILLKGEFAADKEAHVTPGKHQLTFQLADYAPILSGSVSVSRLYMGQVSGGAYPCVDLNSENRVATFQNGGTDYVYMLNESGKYFRTDGFR